MKENCIKRGVKTNCPFNFYRLAIVLLFLKVDSHGVGRQRCEGVGLLGKFTKVCLSGKYESECLTARVLNDGKKCGVLIVNHFT